MPKETVSLPELGTMFGLLRDVNKLARRGLQDNHNAQGFVQPERTGLMSRLKAEEYVLDQIRLKTDAYAEGL